MKNCFVDLDTRGILDLSPEMVPDSWTITRISVPAEHRRRGVGNKLLGEALAEADREGIKLTLEINPYGAMTYDELESWYMRNGFRHHPRYGGFYIRYPSPPTH